MKARADEAHAESCDAVSSLRQRVSKTGSRGKCAKARCTSGFASVPSTDTASQAFQAADTASQVFQAADTASQAFQGADTASQAFQAADVISIPQVASQVESPYLERQTMAIDVNQSKNPKRIHASKRREIMRKRRIKFNLMRAWAIVLRVIQALIDIVPWRRPSRIAERMFERVLERIERLDPDL